MCGILVILGEDVIEDEALEELKLLIDKRGPDFSSRMSQHYTKCGIALRLKASVLHLRGNEMQKQPAIDEFGNILLFNGQIYEFSGSPLNEHLSDTLFLLDRLQSCESTSDIAEIFSQIDGPFAFVYWHENLSSLLYGRDFFGRKSLCSLQNGGLHPHVISSIARPGVQVAHSGDLNWHEVDCKGFHCLEFEGSLSGGFKIKRYLWDLNRIYPKTGKCVPFSKDSKDVGYYMLRSIPLAPLNSDSRLHRTFSDEDMRMTIDRFEKKFLEAVSKRVRFNRDTCLVCRSEKKSTQRCTHSKVVVAFSGGIDSTLIAVALDKVFDKDQTIDLSTVAFKDGSPDRESVGVAFTELRELCPERNWRLILRDVAVSVLQKERDEVISGLISPCNSVVDDSLGCGCWFISQARGRALDSSLNEASFDQIFSAFLSYDTSNQSAIEYNSIIADYTSPATMFFAGMGIDEQLGGYSSHRAAWSSSGMEGLHEEIRFQMRRISSRNLGRDDRTCSHHGRDVKLPFLDFDLVSYLNQLPIGLKMDLDQPPEVGPKKLLRNLAARWGLEKTSKRVKRALQFGTRIANLENAKEKGNEICSRLSDENHTPLTFIPKKIHDA